jgi:hypothetical protein
VEALGIVAVSGGRTCGSSRVVRARAHESLRAERSPTVGRSCQQSARFFSRAVLAISVSTTYRPALRRTSGPRTKGPGT